MKYYIIAGEASGDLHGSNLVKEIKKLDPVADIRCWGGDKMQEAGATLVKHYRELAFMGFTEVVMNLRTIFKNLKFCRKDILQFNPDALILIDYPGFNLRIANWAKKAGLFSGKIIYYISPQVWAWKEGRVKMMRECIDKMLVILPFEKEFFKTRWNWDVTYVGHPLVQVIEDHRKNFNGTLLSQRPIIALLPGSRKQEIMKKLPVMLEVSNAYPGYDFFVARAPGIEESFYEGLVQPFPNVSFVTNQTYDLLLQADAALVTSGTATLETALFKVPEVVCYKGSFLSYQIGKRLVNVKYISLVNLILDRLVVNELIQDKLTAENLKKELHELLNSTPRKTQLQSDYTQLEQMLKQGGNASKQAAEAIVEMVNKK